MAEDIVQQLGYLTLGTRLKRIGERMQAETQRILEAYELEVPSGQFPFLAAIDRLGPLTIGELANAVGVTQPGVTRTVAQLAVAGLVKVELAHEDQRRKTVSLTARSKRIVDIGKQAAWPVIDNAVRDLCHNLTGSLLDQLTGIEKGLVAKPLYHRAKKKKVKKL